MAFVKLFPPKGSDALPIADVIHRLEDEFSIVDADPEKGQDHVADMIVATLRFSDAIPSKQEQVARLQSAQGGAVYVSFGDQRSTMARCCVIPDSELFFDSPEEIDGPARPLVERAASALGYVVFDG
jgi:hypothetical protein